MNTRLTPIEVANLVEDADHYNFPGDLVRATEAHILASAEARNKSIAIVETYMGQFPAGDGQLVPVGPFPYVKFHDSMPPVGTKLYMEEKIMPITIQDAMDVVTNHVRFDNGYAWSWHCNIAMASVDAGMSHKEANKAAARFMQLAFQTDVTQFPEYLAIMEDQDANATNCTD